MSMNKVVPLSKASQKKLIAYYQSLQNMNNITRESYRSNLEEIDRQYQREVDTTEEKVCSTSTQKVCM